MFTKDEHENLLKEIAETGGDTENMLNLLQRLRDDFDEREGMLRREGENTDETSPVTTEVENEIREESVEDNREDGGLRRNPVPDGFDNWRDAYSDLKRKYIERFFTTPDEVKKENENDVKRDSKPQTFDELFKNKEG